MKPTHKGDTKVKGNTPVSPRGVEVLGALVAGVFVDPGHVVLFLGRAVRTDLRDELVGAPLFSLEQVVHRKEGLDLGIPGIPLHGSEDNRKLFVVISIRRYEDGYGRLRKRMLGQR